MRIGFDAKRATLNFRGLGNYSRGIIEGLLEYSEHHLLLYSQEVKNERALAWLQQNSNKKLQMRMPKSNWEKFFPSFWRSFSILSDLRNDDLDIFHGLSHELPVGIKTAPFKSVVTIHDLIFLRYPEFFPFVDRVAYKNKFSYSTKNADLILAICEQTKLDLMHFLKIDEKKIKVHYQSCDPLFYKILSNEEKDEVLKKYNIKRPYLLNVGGFEERKNQLTLIEAFSSLSNKIEENLILIGNGKKYLDQCKKKVEDLRLSSRVFFLQDIPYSHLPALYQSASLFLFPSLFEGFGIPIVEALFSQTPVMTSFGSAFPESAGPNSAYIDPLSVHEISQKISFLLANKLHREKMITNGYTFVQKFHRKNSTENLLRNYDILFQ